MAGLLVGLSVMAVLMSVALPQWSHLARREKEIELVWRGQQYARAVDLFQRQFANTFPPSIDLLVEQRFLRQKYKDPITDDEFQPIFMGQPMPGAPTPAGGGGLSLGQPASTARTAQIAGGAQGPIVGVTSKSTETSIRVWNGRSRYNEWAFVHTPVTNQPGMPGQGGAPGEPQMRPQPLPGQGGGGVRPGGSGNAPVGPGAAPPSGMRPPTSLPPLQPREPRRPPGG
jgi:type II secretory pathway pseudopilin PulG